MPDAASVMDGDPGRARRRVEQGVQDRPVGDGVALVPHCLRLAVRRGDRARVEMVAAKDHRRLQLPGLDHAVDENAQAVPLAVTEPADAGRQALEVDLLPGQGDPAGERGVVLELAQDDVVDPGDVGRVSGQGCPPERAAADAEQRPDEGGDEPGKVEGVGDPAGHGLGADIVAVVEDDGASALELQHGLDVHGHGIQGAVDVVLWILGP